MSTAENIASKINIAANAKLATITPWDAHEVVIIEVGDNRRIELCTPDLWEEVAGVSNWSLALFDSEIADYTNEWHAHDADVTDEWEIVARALGLLIEARS